MLPNVINLTDVLGSTGIATYLQSSLRPYAESAAKDHGAALRPLVDGESQESAQAFLYGDDFIVLRPSSTSRRVSVNLPEGTWINYWTGIQTMGNQTVDIDVPAGNMPIWARGGAVVPRFPVDVRGRVMPQSDDSCGAHCLLDIFPGHSGDDFDTFRDTAGHVIIREAGSMKIEGPDSRFMLRWRYMPALNVRVNGVPLQLSQSNEGFYAEVNHSGTTEVEWSFRPATASYTAPARHRRY